MSRQVLLLSFRRIAEQIGMEPTVQGEMGCKDESKSGCLRLLLPGLAAWLRKLPWNPPLRLMGCIFESEIMNFCIDFFPTTTIPAHIHDKIKPR